MDQVQEYRRPWIKYTTTKRPFNKYKTQTKYTTTKRPWNKYLVQDYRKAREQ